MGSLNRGDLVTRGLQRGGQPYLTTEARYFLNSLLSHLYQARTWEFLSRTATVSSGSNLGELDISALSPAYQSFQRLLITSPTNYRGVVAYGPEMGLKYNDIWEKVEEAAFNSETAAPVYCVADPQKQHILLYPTPAESVTAKLRYYCLPAEISVADGGDSSTPDWPDDHGMITAIAFFAREWRNLDGAQLLERASEMLIARISSSHIDEGRGGPARIKYGTGFKKLSFD